MKEIIIEVPDEFGKTLKPWKANAEIRSELVRCNDCRYGQKCTAHEAIQCFKWNSGEFGELHAPDWFCADGERKEE